MRPQPLIAVTDVEASSRWYQRLLGCRSAHGGAEYERLVSNGALILQLHSFEVEHHHGPIGDPDDKRRSEPLGMLVTRSRRLHRRARELGRFGGVGWSRLHRMRPESRRW